jgi:CDP-diacylglycerol--serine O-phosphatidyltransferase
MTTKKSKAQTIKERITQTKNPELSVARLLPNLLTIAALCTGLSAIRFAMLGHFETAVLAILIAAFLDALDGRLARLLQATSEFGVELDSLSDFISFGVAPSVVIYILTMYQWKGLGWGVVLFFTVCTALRLARFNVMTLYAKQEPQKIISNDFFVGVPAPAGAFIALLPLTLFLASDLLVFINPYFYTFFLVGAGVLMISRLPTFSFKSVKIHRKMVIPTMIFAAILVAAVVSIPWITLSIIILTYLTLLPFSYLSHKKHQRKKA